jgi:hypothetical protein
MPAAAARGETGGERAFDYVTVGHVTIDVLVDPPAGAARPDTLRQPGEAAPPPGPLRQPGGGAAPPHGAPR